MFSAFHSFKILHQISIIVNSQKQIHVPYKNLKIKQDGKFSEQTNFSLEFVNYLSIT